MRMGVNKIKYGLKFVYDRKLLAKLLYLSVWSMLHAFISVAPIRIYARSTKKAPNSAREDAIAAPEIPKFNLNINQ